MAANSISTAWRSFWHTMTSNDRHASHDSAYRTGRHMPLSQSRTGPLGTQATTAMESSTDLANDGAFSANNLQSPSVRSPQQTPYSPGARSQAVRRGSSDTVNQGEIQMQNFEEGLPPPPPVSHSWKRVDRWVEDNYTELFDQLGEGATNNDLNELEHELDCSLPVDVRESIMCHDGQERGGRPTGILFGCMLLDCEEIVQEWRNWRIVNEEYLNAAPTGGVSINMATSSKSMAGPGVGSSSAPPPAGGSSGSGPNPMWRQELLDRQESQPPRAIQKAYAHPAWIPMARDWGGNNLAVDLSPGPSGKWGQVIIFGRDYDCKYVVARSWGAFMAQLADDFGSGKAEIDDDSEWDGKLRLKQFKDVDPPYFEILRWRTDQKYGRRFPRRKGPGGPGGPNGQKRGSPYGSPTSERGRSPQRFPATGVGSPARVGSPLARVDEEGKVSIAKPGSINTAAAAGTKLVDAPTPAASTTDLVGDAAADKPQTEKKGMDDKVGLGVEGLEGEMKSVAI